MIISLLLLTTGTFAHAQRIPKVLTGTMRTTYFDVHYDPADPYLARLMADTSPWLSRAGSQYTP